MSLILKIMAGDGQPDASSQAQFELHTNVGWVKFCRGPTGAYADVVTNDLEGERYSVMVPGNAYVLSENGKTIASFGGAPPSCDSVGSE